MKYIKYYHSNCLRGKNSKLFTPVVFSYMVYDDYEIYEKEYEQIINEKNHHICDNSNIELIKKGPDGLYNQRYSIAWKCAHCLKQIKGFNQIYLRDTQYLDLYSDSMLLQKQVNISKLEYYLYDNNIYYVVPIHTNLLLSNSKYDIYTKLFVTDNLNNKKYDVFIISNKKSDILLKDIVLYFIENNNFDPFNLQETENFVDNIDDNKLYNIDYTNNIIDEIIKYLGNNNILINHKSFLRSLPMENK